MMDLWKILHNTLLTVLVVLTIWYCGWSALYILRLSKGIKELDNLIKYGNLSTSTINVPNILTGENEKFVIFGVSQTTDGAYVPLMVNEESYSDLLDKIRLQIVTNVEKRDR